MTGCAAAPVAALSPAAGSGLLCVELWLSTSHDGSVGEEGRAARRSSAAKDEVLQVAAAGGDRPEPAVRHLLAVGEVGEVEVLHSRLGHLVATAPSPLSVTFKPRVRPRCCDNWRLGHPAATAPSSPSSRCSIHHPR